MALTTPSVSPAIVIKEIDLTGVAPNVETSLSGMVGQFKWGPVNDPQRVQNKEQLASQFGAPDNLRAVDYYSAEQYLRYSGNLILNRQVNNSAPIGDSAVNATLSSVPVLIENDKVFESYAGSQLFLAKYPGELGNSIEVSLFQRLKTDLLDDAALTATYDGWKYSAAFNGFPGTSPWAASLEGDVKFDEIHVAVVDKAGLISGTKNTVLEVFPYVSVAKGAKTVDGGDNYIGTVINNGSNYVRFGQFGDSDNMIGGTLWGTAPSGPTVQNFGANTWSQDSATGQFAGGRDCPVLEVADYQAGFSHFEDKEEIDVQILIAPGMNTEEDHVAVVNNLVGIASATRKDCVVVASPNRAAVVGNVNAVDATIQTTNQFSASNYLMVDNNYLRVADEFNDTYIYVPAASTTAGLLAATDASYGPWYSPAGERRGEYFGATGLAYSPNKAQRDELYKVGVNPVVQFAGRGILLFGDKTKQSRASAFDRINVRRLFLAVEKSVALAARNFMFEFNDEFTRSELVAIVEPLLREIQSRRGIEDFYVQCDSRNNTDEVRARNELVASIFIKPTYSINFITLNFVATRAGLDFEEVVGTLS